MTYIRSVDAKACKLVICGWINPMKDDAEVNKVPKQESKWTFEEDSMPTHNSRASMIYPMKQILPNSR